MVCCHWPFSRLFSTSQRYDGTDLPRTQGFRWIFVHCLQRGKHFWLKSSEFFRAIRWGLCVTSSISVHSETLLLAVCEHGSNRCTIVCHKWSKCCHGIPSVVQCCIHYWRQQLQFSNLFYMGMGAKFINDYVKQFSDTSMINDWLHSTSRLLPDELGEKFKCHNFLLQKLKIDVLFSKEMAL